MNRIFDFNPFASDEFYYFVLETDFCIFNFLFFIILCNKSKKGVRRQCDDFDRVFLEEEEKSYL